MKIVGVVLVAVTAMVFGQDDEAQVLDQYYEPYNEETKRYQFSFSSSNGIQREEIGQVYSDDYYDGDLYVQGSYSYPGTDGIIYTVTYTADKNGYKPVISKRIGGVGNTRISSPALESLSG